MNEKAGYEVTLEKIVELNKFLKGRDTGKHGAHVIDAVIHYVEYVERSHAELNNELFCERMEKYGLEREKERMQQRIEELEIFTRRCTMAGEGGLPLLRQDANLLMTSQGGMKS